MVKKLPLVLPIGEQKNQDHLPSACGPAALNGLMVDTTSCTTSNILNIATTSLTWFSNLYNPFHGLLMVCEYWNSSRKNDDHKFWYSETGRVFYT